MRTKRDFYVALTRVFSREVVPRIMDCLDRMDRPETGQREQLAQAQRLKGLLRRKDRESRRVA